MVDKKTEWLFVIGLVIVAIAIISTAVLRRFLHV